MSFIQEIHFPVMVQEVVLGLRPSAGALLVDSTFGAGGYTRALLEASSSCHVIAIDRDYDAIVRGQALVEHYAPRLTLVEGRFGSLVEILNCFGVHVVDGIAFDLGVSSPQLDTAGRGFSFRLDGPLDMRMDGERLDGRSAADFVNEESEDSLTKILFEFGGERYARRVASAIVRKRVEAPITRTGQLAALVHSIVPRVKGGIDSATRSFQGLRIAVNDELGELSRGLVAAEKLLRPGGKLAVVSFHSLEDRVIKRFFASRIGKNVRPSRHMPYCHEKEKLASFCLSQRRPITPSVEELHNNPRARSAHLRVAERTAAPPVFTE